MLIDLTLKVSPTEIQAASLNEQMVALGHLGTHFDVMNKEFPLSYIKRKGIVFDVSGSELEDEIELPDHLLYEIELDMFVAFHSGFTDAVEYGSKGYFKEHPQLSHHLIDALCDKNISIIGIDFAGVRRGKEHTPKDQYCADRGVFIVENLCNLQHVLQGSAYATFLANTYPVNFTGMSGLPCRVVAEI